MNYLIGEKQDFFNFIDSIKPEDKVGIITHTDLDGISSAILLEEILENKGHKISLLHFTGYQKGMFNKLVLKLKNKEINKLFITDVYADGTDLEGFNKFRKEFDVFLIDHHPVDPGLKNTKNIIKTKVEDCCTIVIEDLGKDLIKNDWHWLVLATMVSEWSFNNPENLKRLQKEYPNLTKQNAFESIPGEASKKLSSASTYYKSNLNELFDLIKKKDFKKINAVHDTIEEILQKNLEEYKEKAEYYPEKKLYFYVLDLKDWPSLTSAISTILSRHKQDTTFIAATETKGGFIKISAKNQSRKIDMNTLLKKGIKGLEKATAGGHVPAAGGKIMKKDLKEFKKRILS